MNINRNTYENIFIDYLEGKLSDSELKVFIEFLDQNEDLEQELRLLISYRNESKASASDIDALKKDNLKKESILENEDSNFEELCISFYEGLLSEKEEEYLLELIEDNNNLLKTFNSYAQTVSKSDLSIQFPNKAKLKKHKKINWFQYTSYAASIIFIVSFIFIIQNKKNTEQLNKVPQLAKIEEKYKNNIRNKQETKTEQIVVKQQKEKPEEETATQNSKTQIKRTIKPVEYNNYDLIEENIDINSKIISRKGKLAYTSLSELENYLFKLFEEEGIDKEVSHQEIKKIEDSNKPKKRNQIQPKYNIQLATSIDPFEYQKLILGSESIE